MYAYVHVESNYWRMDIRQSQYLCTMSRIGSGKLQCVDIEQLEGLQAW